MVKYYPDLFNDVFGPIMQPGSSSHTAGPCRLGYMAHQLLKNPLKDIRIELDKNGSFAGTFGLMNEDLGMLAGAYGLCPDDERIFDIKEILRTEAISFNFEYVEFEQDAHPNAVSFILTDNKNCKIQLKGNSTGGGMVETVDIMGIPYRFIGDSFLTCICFGHSAGSVEISENDMISALGSEHIFKIQPVQNQSKEQTYIIQSSQSLSRRHYKKLQSLGGEILFEIPPVLPVSSSEKKKKQLFTSFSEWVKMAERENISLARAVLLYEQNSSGMTEREILSRMKRIKGYMERQTQAVYENDDNLLETPYSGYHYSKWRQYETGGTVLAGSVIAKAVHYSFGVQALMRGVKMVPGPMGTGGGYLYAAMRAVKEEYGFSEEKLIDGLLTAGGVGIIAYTRTNPTGEILGCAGECGVCAAMASAGITQMAGGTPKQAEAAASLTLQMALGWPCDPIPGGNNQPCMSRVLSAVVMAVTFADIALSGRSAVIPFDEVIDEAAVLGKAMPSELKCTSCGGLCETPTAKKLKKAFEDWHDFGAAAE